MRDADGTIEIVAQAVRVVSPVGDGEPASIAPAEGVSVFVNDLLIDTVTHVFADDNVRLVPQADTVQEEGGIEIDISEDGMSAFLVLRPHVFVHYEVVDAPATLSLTPAVEQSLHREDNIDSDGVYRRLAESGVIYGIDRNAIGEALQRKDGEKTLIASGLPPQPGKDAVIEVFFPVTAERLTDEDSIENIDFWERSEIHSVEKDSLLLKKTPAVAGTQGKSVTGDPVYPPSVQDYSLTAGPNTHLSNDGLEIYASVLGRPVLRKKHLHYTVSVESVFILRGDADLTTGHINFRGDIMISGKVAESMKISSENNIKIIGSVTGALIKTEGSVTIQNNVINSKVYAGLGRSFSLRVYPQLEEFESTLAGLLKAYQQIKQMPGYENARFGYILDLLVEKKYPTLPRQVEALAESLTLDAKYNLNEDITSAIAGLKDLLGSFDRLPYQEITSAVELLKTTGLVKNKIRVDSSRSSDIYVHYCLNSYLEACGNVTVAGQGCFHTEIVALGGVEIKGVARGGTITAQHDIRIGKVGSEGAVKTDLIVPADRMIYLGEVFENTVVTMGGATHRFTVPGKRVKVFRDPNSGIVVSTY